VLLFSPKRPIVDISEVFLWVMAVGTILGASFWSAWTAKEAAQEHYRRLKVQLCCIYVVSCIFLWSYLCDHIDSFLNACELASITAKHSCYFQICNRNSGSWLQFDNSLYLLVGTGEVRADVMVVVTVIHIAFELTEHVVRLLV
jgi:hypothetical protein